MRRREVQEVYVQVRKIVEGFHQWKKCPIKAVGFLKERHRHLFHIDVGIQVRKSSKYDAKLINNREVEFFMVQRAIDKKMKKLYGKQPFEFGSRSCEQIATELGNELVKKYPSIIRVGVHEDGENGAIALFV
jgi:hypothetical protein